MPFSGPTSYLATIDEFISHWTDVDLELGLGGPLELQPDGYGVAELTTDRGTLATHFATVETAINAWEVFRGSRDNQKPLSLERMRQLFGIVKTQLRDSSYVEAVPNLVKLNDSSGKWIVALEDALSLWTSINAAPPAGFTPPLLLHDGYAIATFTTDVNTLKATFADVNESARHVDVVLEDRDKTYRSIRDRVVQYRGVVESTFASDHPLVLSLPRVTPLPGHTPDPVVLSGSWNAGTSQADLSWTASADVDLDHYEVRRSGSDPYNSNTEQMVDSVPAGTLTLSTTEGLPGSGSTMRYKVYVVLNTNNEKGSNAVEIDRP